MRLAEAPVGPARGGQNLIKFLRFPQGERGLRGKRDMLTEQGRRKLSLMRERGFHQPTMLATRVTNLRSVHG